MSTNAGPFTYPHPYTGQIMDATTGQPYVPPTPARSMSDLHIHATTTAQELYQVAMLIGRTADRTTNPIDRANLLSTLKTIHDAAVLIDTFANLDEE